MTREKSCFILPLTHTHLYPHFYSHSHTLISHSFTHTCQCSLSFSLSFYAIITFPFSLFFLKLSHLIFGSLPFASSSRWNWMTLFSLFLLSCSFLRIQRIRILSTHADQRLNFVPCVQVFHILFLLHTLCCDKYLFLTITHSLAQAHTHVHTHSPSLSLSLSFGHVPPVEFMLSPFATRIPVEGLDE